MAQTRNNNLSPLPFYGSRAEQSDRLPWAFGDMFPLRCDSRLLPFYFTREAQTIPGAGDEIGVGAYEGHSYLTAEGSWGTDKSIDYGVNSYDDVSAYLVDIGARYKALYVKNLPYPPTIEGVNTVNVVCKDADGNLLSARTYGTAGSYYNGFIYCPDDTAQVLMQCWDGSVNASLHKVTQVPRPISSGYLYDREGNETQVDFGDSIHITDTDDGRQMVWFNADAEVLSGVERGTYCLRLYRDYAGDYIYSEWFTYAAAPNVRIEWYDKSDQTLASGYIPYSQGYVNRVWLNTSVGFPDYETDKEGDERDGYFFMEKGISRKVYRMKFIAPEYLCDVLRLIPVSDIVTIWDSSRGAEIEYDVDDVDMEVEWQEQGNLAAVTLTFKTDTVVKALGKII